MKAAPSEGQAKQASRMDGAGYATKRSSEYGVQHLPDNGSASPRNKNYTTSQDKQSAAMLSKRSIQEREILRLKSQLQASDNKTGKSNL